jgi:type I restriction enzyme S subunit
MVTKSNHWSMRPIGNVGEVLGGRQRSYRITAGSLRPYLRVANVFDGYIDYSDVLEMPFTDGEFQKFALQPGDILFNEGQSLELVGRNARFDGPANKFAFQNTLVRFRAGKQITIDYATQLFRYLFITGRFISIARKTTSIAHLGSSRLAMLEVPIPPLCEQQQIAKVLGEWDKSIRQTEQLIEAKRKLKKGLMQQMLTGKQRFLGFREIWLKKKLGEVFRERKETGCPELSLLSITGDQGVIPHSEIGRKDSSAEDKSKYKRIAPGDIGYNTMRMWQGVSALSCLDGIVSPAYTICVPKHDIDGSFAAHLFKFPPVVHLFYRYSQGLVSDTLNLKFPHFAQVTVELPPLSEQKKIASVLNSLDQEIKSLIDLSDRLKEQKRGLMQKLLTGQIRVKTTEEITA